MRLLFLHGWGFDGSLWNGLRQALAPEEAIVWDRGYFGSEQRAMVAAPFIAIGHSLGSMILSADPPPGCRGLVAINGFDRFAGEDAVPRRVVYHMRRRFDEAPREVLNTFRIRCGGVEQAGMVDEKPLSDDLSLLATADAQGGMAPLVVLNGGQDPILPAAMRDTVFAGAPRVAVSDGGHLLPLTHPEWCAARIREVLA